LIQIARQTVLSVVGHSAPPVLSAKTGSHGVFVTIESDNKVLGCRGTLTPHAPTLEQEVVEAAQSACMHDPRYKPLTQLVLKRFLVTVTVVEGLEPIQTVKDLEPSDGLVLESGDRKGVVLPWEGKDPLVRLKWAYKKAGVPEGSACELYRLKGDRYRG
jgi:AMMECR1 domain-containing protein